jgi:hypothetical protein
LMEGMCELMLTKFTIIKFYQWVSRASLVHLFKK